MLHNQPSQNQFLRRARLSVLALAAWWIGASMMLPAANAASEEGTFEKTVSVGCQPVTVNVTTTSGNVNIRPGDDGVVRVIGHVSIDADKWTQSYPSADQAVTRLREEPPVEQDGDTVSIGTIKDPDLTGDISISYEIKVPSTTSLKVRIGSGSSDIHQIDAPVDAASVSGHVTVTDVKGTVIASSESGAVDVRSVSDTATISVGSGETNGTDLSDVKVKATTGPVTFHQVHGLCDVAVETGNISVDGAPSDSWKLHSDAGTVAISVMDPANFELNAQAPSGDIHNSLKISESGGTQSGTLVGSVGDGGPAVDLSTDRGDISIE